MNIEVEDREPTQPELDLMAAKQLLTELTMIKKRIYQSGTLMNGVLVVQIKGVIGGLMRKYHEAGVLLGENTVLKMQGYDSRASFSYIYTPYLKTLMEKATQDALQYAENKKEKENGT